MFAGYIHESKELVMNELIELGMVVSETKAHDHGLLWDWILPTTSPDQG
jgi:hypothetical protein